MRQAFSLKTGALAPRTRPAARALCLLCASVFCAFGAGLPLAAQAGQAEDLVQPSAESAPQATEPETSYKVGIEGVEDAGLMSLLRATSQLISLADKPPATDIGLRRRAEDDVERLRTALRSEGYYASEIDLDIATESTPVQVTLRIAPGPRYRLAAYDVSYVGDAPPADAARPTLTEIGIDIGMPARAPTIVAAGQSLVNLLQERGYPFARIADRKTFVKQETSEMTVELSADAGPPARFGALSFKGRENIEEGYLRRVAGWPQGDVYDRRKVRELQSRLAGTGLFSTVNAETAATPAADGSLPVTVTLVEREQRSIGATASISSDIGPGGELFWEHRNLLGRNEKLRVSGTASLIEQTGALDFRKPAFLERDQALLANITGGFQDNDAYKRQSVEGLVALERHFLENWQISAGVSAGYEIVDESADNSDDGEQQFSLFGLPLAASRDTTDDALDPASGTRLQLSLTPTTGAGDKPLLFLAAVAGGSVYYAIDEAERIILAGRARVGSIVGEKTEALPASRRFYAGGGGSIRGYQYQLVGPLDNDDDPFGGVSLVEMGAEIRVRITEEFGVVPFLDGGTVYDDPYFASGETLRWAAGLGLRYFTGFGPVRLDVAFPLNPRSGVDDAFQFYISFGQAF